MRARVATGAPQRAYSHGTDLAPTLGTLEMHHEDLGMGVAQPLQELLTFALVVAPTVMELLPRGRRE